MNSGCVDLIYLDPPFNSDKDYAAPIGSEAAGASFKDSWTLSDVDEAWHGEIAERHPALYAVMDAAGLAHGKSMKAYLIMMAVRLIEMHRILKPTGSIYLHCDPTASHYLKMLVDAVFGRHNFRNEVAWHYKNRWPAKAKKYQANHDAILFYSKTDQYTFVPVMIPGERVLRDIERGWSSDTVVRKGQKVRRLRVYDEKKVKSAEASGRLPVHDEQVLQTGKSGLKPCSDVWDINLINPVAKERTGYPTQKPLALLDRIIRASSNPGDVVLDPFCGCATALVASDRLERQWVGIDLSSLAASLVMKRIREDRGPLFNDVVHRTDIPTRTDLGELPSYRTHKHTLFGRQEGICTGCQVLFPFRNMTVDHIIPRARGGQDNLDNLQLLCAACNATKGTGSHEELIVRLKESGIR